MNKVSYALGVSIAKNLQSQGFSVASVEDFVEGINNVYDNTQIQLNDEELNQVIQEEHKKVSAVKFEKSIEEGKKFLEENKSKEGIVTLDSGLQYEVITEGNGDKPTAESTVTTHYHGTLIDGTVFDSSVQRGEPASFPVNGVIAGWTEALQLMPVGSKWKLYVPSELAYGERGAGQLIGPYTTLVFEVELLSIQ